MRYVLGAGLMTIEMRGIYPILETRQHLFRRMSRRVVSRELALERVWDGRAAASPNVVDRYVSYLRRKLGEPPLIETVRGAGFVLGR